MVNDARSAPFCLRLGKGRSAGPRCSQPAASQEGLGGLAASWTRRLRSVFCPPAAWSCATATCPGVGTNSLTYGKHLLSLWVSGASTRDSQERAWTPDAGASLVAVTGCLSLKLGAGGGSTFWTALVTTGLLLVPFPCGVDSVLSL